MQLEYRSGDARTANSYPPIVTFARLLKHSAELRYPASPPIFILRLRAWAYEKIHNSPRKSRVIRHPRAAPSLVLFSFRSYRRFSSLSPSLSLSLSLSLPLSLSLSFSHLFLPFSVFLFSLRFLQPLLSLLDASNIVRSFMYQLYINSV